MCFQITSSSSSSSKKKKKKCKPEWQRPGFEETMIGFAPLMCDENVGEVADSIQNLWTLQLDYLECASKKGTLSHHRNH